jgi:hypothetical protein
VKKPAETTPEVKVEPPAVQELELLGLAKVPAGWVVVKVKTQGHRVIETEVISQPEARGHANRRWAMETIKLQAEHIRGGVKS